MRASFTRHTRIKLRSFLEIFSLAVAKESQWFWAIPNAPRFFKVRFTKIQSRRFLEGDFFGGEVEDEDITLAPPFPCACTQTPPAEDRRDRERDSLKSFNFHKQVRNAFE